MALTDTPICDFGRPAVDFNLPGVDGKSYTLSDVKGENGTLVMSICNHCPYVLGILDRFPQTATVLLELGIGVAAISANDAAQYPVDSFDNMKHFSADNGFNFPYLFDESQETARAYGAVCTPDFFGFDKNGGLQYRGRLDSAGKNPVSSETTSDLINAMRLVVETGKGPEQQIASMGCSIKWR